MVGFHPTYKKIGDYTEAIRIEYNPKVITYRAILDEFFRQQGGPPFWGGLGRQYRSAIFYHSEEQRREAAGLLDELSAKFNGRKICCDLEPGQDFFFAEVRE